MWVTFVYCVILPGALLTMMLVSGMKLLVDLASLVLNSPVRIQKAQISIALFMTGFSGLLGVLSYSGLQRAESKLADGRKFFALQPGFQDQLERNVFWQGRNFWLSILGMTLWGVAWRLKTLFDCRTLVVQRPSRAARPLQSRLVYVAIALVCLALADVPICRLNYSLQLATFITPKKANLLEFSQKNGCENVQLASAQGACAELCAETRKLSDDRLWAINWARNWHLFGRLAAKTFDGFRSVEQGQARIEQLFQERTCERVLQSTDKSNSMVNIACGVFAGLSIMGFLVAIQNALNDDAAPDSSATDVSAGIAVAHPVSSAGQVPKPSEAAANVAKSPKSSEAASKPGVSEMENLAPTNASGSAARATAKKENVAD